MAPCFLVTAAILICVSMAVGCAGVKIGMYESEVQHGRHKRAEDFPDYPADFIPGDPAGDPSGEPVMTGGDPTGSEYPDTSATAVNDGAAVVIQTPRKGKAKRRLHKKIPRVSDSQSVSDLEKTQSGTGQGQGQAKLFECSGRSHGSSDPRPEAPSEPAGVDDAVNNVVPAESV